MATLASGYALGRRLHPHEGPRCRDALGSDALWSRVRAHGWSLEWLELFSDPLKRNYPKLFKELYLSQAWQHIAVIRVL